MRVLAVMLWLGLAGLVPAQAQALVDRNFYDGRTPALEQTIRFCIVTNSPLRDFDRAIADAIGSALLVRSETFGLDLSIVRNSRDREGVLFINLMDNCDAVMGTNLAWNPLPDWLTVSRPYYNAPYMLAVREGTYHRLDEIPIGGAVGSSLYSVVDQLFVTYLGTLQPQRRWRRLPYDDIPTMLADIRAGTIEGGLLSGPLAGEESSAHLDGSLWSPPRRCASIRCVWARCFSAKAPSSATQWTRRSGHCRWTAASTDSWPNTGCRPRSGSEPERCGAQASSTRSSPSSAFRPNSNDGVGGSRHGVTAAAPGLNCSHRSANSASRSRSGARIPAR